jgi:hypothetical protein
MASELTWAENPGQSGHHGAKCDQPAWAEAVDQMTLEGGKEGLQHDQQREGHLQRGGCRAQRAAERLGE